MLTNKEPLICCLEQRFSSVGVYLRITWGAAGRCAKPGGLGRAWLLSICRGSGLRTMLLGQVLPGDRHSLSARSPLLSGIQNHLSFIQECLMNTYCVPGIQLLASLFLVFVELWRVSDAEKLWGPASVYSQLSLGSALPRVPSG